MTSFVQQKILKSVRFAAHKLYIVMKLTAKNLRSIIAEEYMRGVPEFMVREVVEDCASKVEGHIKRYIQLKSQSPLEARQLHDNANEMLEDLKKELFDTIEGKIWSFMHKS